MQIRTVKCTVEGRVQGVFFRAETRARAAELGIDGWVRNTPDGRVEAVASGEDDAVERFVAWLWQGSPRSSVTAVTVEEWCDAVEAGFSIEKS